MLSLVWGSSMLYNEVLKQECVCHQKWTKPFSKLFEVFKFLNIKNLLVWAEEFPWWSSGWDSASQHRGPRFHPWLGN